MIVLSGWTETTYKTKVKSEFILKSASSEIFFLMLTLLIEHLFWPPSMVYISVINTQTLQITFLHDIRIQIWTIQLLLFTEKFSPLPWFEPGTKPICYQLSHPGLDRSQQVFKWLLNTGPFGNQTVKILIPEKITTIPLMAMSWITEGGSE